MFFTSTLINIPHNDCKTSHKFRLSQLRAWLPTSPPSPSHTPSSKLRSVLLCKWAWYPHGWPPHPTHPSSSLNLHVQQPLGHQQCDLPPEYGFRGKFYTNPGSKSRSLWAGDSGAPHMVQKVLLKVQSLNLVLELVSLHQVQTGKATMQSLSQQFDTTASSQGRILYVTEVLISHKQEIKMLRREGLLLINAQYREAAGTVVVTALSLWAGA